MINKNPFNTKQIKKEMKDIDRLDIKVASVEYLKKRYLNITQALFSVSIGLDRTKEFNICRSRVGFHSKISDLWYPPKADVTSLGRMNEVGESMFYSCHGSSAKLGAIEEIYAKPGDTVTQLFCATNSKHLKLIAIGHKDKEISGYKSHQENFFNSVGVEHSERYKNSLIHDWLGNALTKKVAPEESYKYKKTIAISRSYFEGTECDGVLFPSVASVSKCTNLILKPDVADKYLIPVKARVVQVLYYDEKGVALRYIKQSTSIVDGVINWENVTSGVAHHDAFFNGSKYTKLKI